ncbi:hypothetical protein [Rhodococcus sp. NPDC127528]|uniref:hypothetical protein n=1 Tax=unclassified Rhodococcus (in: high G+C Gram-positive bacteria) TaxID=192944 RepID=UPI00363B7445
MLAQFTVFAIGATSCVQIANFTATALSVVCLLLVPAFLLMTHRGVELVPLVLAALGWISYIASGLVHEVSPLWPNAIAPASFSLYLIGLTVITGRAMASIATVLAGISAGTVIFFLFRGIELTRTGSFLDLWKYGIAQSVTILVLYGLAKRARVHRLAFPVALVLLGLASLGLNFRSHALVCLVSGAVVFTRQVMGSRVARGWQFAAIAAFGIAFAYVMPIVARAGLFGPALQRKTVEQQATHLPLLLAGRTEPPMSITAILQRPILGWGSGEKLTPELYTAAEHLAVRMGFAPTYEFDLAWRLPPRDYSAMHSILLGSWVEGGVLAVLLPLWLLVACVGVIWNLERYGVWAPLVVTIAVQGIWDLAYSPWTYNVIPVYACITLFFTTAHFVRPVGDVRPP